MNQQSVDVKRLMDQLAQERQAREKAEAIINPDLRCESSDTGTFDYPAAARSIALYLSEWCDESLPYPQMIAEAARRAHDELARLRGVERALPKTADGVPMVPGMYVWVPQYMAAHPDDGECLVTSVTNFGACPGLHDDPDAERSFNHGGNDCHQDCDAATKASDAYSTRAAALAALTAPATPDAADTQAESKEKA